MNDEQLQVIFEEFIKKELPLRVKRNFSQNIHDINDIIVEIILRLLEKRLPKYDPSRAEFIHYLRFCLKRELQNFRKELWIQNQDKQINHNFIENIGDFGNYLNDLDRQEKFEIIHTQVILENFSLYEQRLLRLYLDGYKPQDLLKFTNTSDNIKSLSEIQLFCRTSFLVRGGHAIIKRMGLALASSFFFL